MKLAVVGLELNNIVVFFLNELYLDLGSNSPPHPGCQSSPGIFTFLVWNPESKTVKNASCYWFGVYRFSQVYRIIYGLRGDSRTSFWWATFVSGTEPLEELEEMILSRFSKVRLGQGKERPTSGGRGNPRVYTSPLPREEVRQPIKGLLRGHGGFHDPLITPYFLGGGWKAYCGGIPLDSGKFLVTWAWGVFQIPGVFFLLEEPSYPSQPWTKDQVGLVLGEFFDGRRNSPSVRSSSLSSVTRSYR